MRSSYLLAICAALTPLATGQDLLDKRDTGNVSIPIWSLYTELHGGTSNVCNKTFADVNATGIFYVNPDVLQGAQTDQPGRTNGKTLDSGLAVTIHTPGGSTNSSNTTSSDIGLWYDTNGANYSESHSLGYDVCALLGFQFNYNTILRGQDDNGTCSLALDDACISGIKSVAETYSGWLTTPSSYDSSSNLTNTSLPGICTKLATDIRDNFPSACSYFFEKSSLDALGWPLTTYENLFPNQLSNNCFLNGSWQNAVSLYNNNSRSVYTTWAQDITPLIVVYMPVADYEATTKISDPVAELTCLKITHYNSDSYEPPALPDPTPIAYATSSTSASTSTNTRTASEHDLPKGAIAGVAVGCAVAAALIVAGIYALTRRKKRQNTAPSGPAADTTDHSKPELSADQNARFEMGQPDPRELSGHDAKYQLPATFEEGGKDDRQWLDGQPINKVPVELPGNAEL